MADSIDARGPPAVAAEGRGVPLVPCRTYLRGRMSLLYRIFRAATRSRGDRRWDLFIRGAGLVALLAIPVAVAFPRRRIPLARLAEPRIEIDDFTRACLQRIVTFNLLSRLAAYFSRQLLIL